MSDEDISLPPSVASDEELLRDEKHEPSGSEKEGSDVSLPSAVGSDKLEGNAGGTCCKQNCSKYFPGTALNDFKSKLEVENSKKQGEIIFERLKRIYRENAAGEAADSGGPKRLKFSLLGSNCCRIFFQQALGVGPGRVDKCCRTFGQGHKKLVPLLKRLNLPTFVIFSFDLDLA